jgi:CubicO group peptidase (beta-lactamase class C family)
MLHGVFVCVTAVAGQRKMPVMNPLNVSPHRPGEPAIIACRGISARMAMVLTVLLTALWTCSSGLAQTDRPDFTLLETLAQSELKRNNVPGAAIAIVVDGRIAFTRGFGVASIETGEPVSSNMLFRIGSTTKMFTAAGLVLLAEEGKVKLDAPIGDYVKGLHPAVARLTSHQLLTHTSGLADANAVAGPHDETALAGRVRAFEPRDFFDEPGRIYSYSNPGYWAAGLVAQEVSGRLYADHLRERIFEPLAMVRTTFRPTMAVTWPFALGHGPEDRSPAKVIRPLSDNAAVWPAGQMFTTAPEFARFCIAFMSGGTLDGRQVLSKFVIEKLSAPHVPVPNDERHYGYGLSVRDENGLRWLSHTGSRSGYGSQARMCPERKFAVIILCNKTGANLMRVADKAVEIALGIASPSRPPRPNRPITAEEATKFAGAYRNGSTTIALTARNGKLFTPRGEVKSLGDNRFVLPGSGEAGAAPMEFHIVPGKDGKAEHLMRNGRAFKRQ